MTPRNRVTKTCQVCGSAFEVRAYRAETARYCSKSCWARRNAPNRRVCPTCGRPFSTYQRRQVFCSRSCARRGRRSNAYKDGRSLERDRARLGVRLREWREAVYARDAYTCQQCGQTGPLHAHHIEPWASAPALRFDVANGVTLCESCHGAIHGKDFGTRRHKTCPDCGATTKGRGKEGRCRSCAIAHWHRSRSTVA